MIIPELHVFAPTLEQLRDYLAVLEDHLAKTDQDSPLTYPMLQSAIKETKAEIKAKEANSKQQKLNALFLEALDGVELGNKSRREVFATMIRPLAQAGLTREEVIQLRPFFIEFLAAVERGEIDLKGDQDVSGTGTDLERDSGTYAAQDAVGGE